LSFPLFSAFLLVAIFAARPFVLRKIVHRNVLQLGGISAFWLILGGKEMGNHFRGNDFGKIGAEKSPLGKKFCLDKCKQLRPQLGPIFSSLLIGGSQWPARTA